MKPTEIIDAFLVNMTAAAFIGVCNGQLVSRNLEEAQDYVAAPYKGLGKDDTIRQALKFLKASDEPITLANEEWIKRYHI